MIINPSASTTVTFVFGKRGALNAVVDGHRCPKNRTYNYKENVYYRCVEQSTCSAQITGLTLTVTDGVLSSSLPDLSHPPQEAASCQCCPRNEFERYKEASSGDRHAYKKIVADSLLNQHPHQNEQSFQTKNVYTIIFRFI